MTLERRLGAGWRPKAEPYSERTVQLPDLLQAPHSVRLTPWCLSLLFLAETLLDLMSTVVRMCPSVCESSHFAVLLGTYSATLSILGEGDLIARLWAGLVGCTLLLS